MLLACIELARCVYPTTGAPIDLSASWIVVWTIVGYRRVTLSNCSRCKGEPISAGTTASRPAMASFSAGPPTC